MATVSSTVIGASQAPGVNPLTIGSVTFNSSETPVSLPIGAEQMVASQTLAGGSRVVQTFGVSPKNISWKGRLFGSFIAARVAQMRLYVSSGNPVQMSWIKSTSAVTGQALQNGQSSTPLSQLKEVYTVVVKDFTPEFFAQYADYTIELIVVKANNGAYTAAAPTSIDSQISALQATANSLTLNLLASSSQNEDAISTAMDAVNASISDATPISQNPLSAANIQQTLQTAQEAVAAYQALQSTGSSGVATAIQLSGVLTAISRNVAAGYSPQSITQQGGNAFGAAAQYYGDVSQAFTLARLAGLPSPFLPSAAFTRLLLPAIQATPQTNQSTTS